MTEMIEPIKLDNDIYFDPYISCIYFNNILNNEEREAIRNSIKNKLDNNKMNIINTKSHIINNLTIIPTMNCEGNCLYCYNKLNNNIINDNLNSDILLNTLNNLKYNGYIFKVNTVNLYGGEPFLNKNIEHIIDCIIENNILNDDAIINISSSLLYDDDKFNNMLNTCKKLLNKKIKFYVSISVDFGTDEINYTRLSIQHSNINKKVLLDRAQELFKNNISVKLSSVITTFTDINKLENEVKNHYENNIKSQFYKTDFRNLNVYDKFTYRFAAVHNNYLFINDDKINDLFDFIKRNKQYLPITQNMFPYFDIFNTADVVKLNDDMFLTLYQPTYCGIYSRSIVILPNGNTSPCHMDPYNNNMCVNDNSKEYDLLFNNKCNECDYYLVCRGGCININKATTNAAAIKSYCSYLKKCINFSIHNFYDYMSKDKFKEYLNNNSRKRD